MADCDVTVPSASSDAAALKSICDDPREADSSPSDVADWSVSALVFGADGLAQARAFVMAAATRSGASASTTFDAQLAASELATNALHHGAPPADIKVRRDGGWLEVAVSDSGAGSPVPQDAGPHAASGRGLHIVASVATEWGVDAGDQGKTVWCRFAL